MTSSTLKNSKEFTHNNDGKHFKTIGEVSLDIGIPPYVIRFWESRFNVIKPQKRKGGHRYYGARDIEKIKEVKRLLYDEGYTIRGAKKHLKNRKMFSSEKIQQSLFSEDFEVTNIKKTEPAAANLSVNQVTIPENNQQVDDNLINSFIKRLESVKDLLK